MARLACADNELESFDLMLKDAGDAGPSLGLQRAARLGRGAAPVVEDLALEAEDENLALGDASMLGMQRSAQLERRRSRSAEPTLAGLQRSAQPARGGSLRAEEGQARKNGGFMAAALHRRASGS